MTYYEVLGIEEDATQEQIKAAYRNLAKKYHPDVNDAQNATAFFRLIQEAYETLSDPAKKAEYDNDSNVPKYEPTDEYANNSYQNDEYINFTGDKKRVYSYEEIKENSKEPFYQNFPFADTILTIIVAAFCFNAFLHIHVAISILIGIGISIILAVLFNTKIGWWVISIFYSAIWTTLIAGIVFTISHDYTWLWCSAGFVFIVSLILHYTPRDSR